MENVPTGKMMPVDIDLGELPSSYGKHRVVLLPVDPYLIYSYWELAGDPPPTTGARAVLRFHETPVSATAEVSRPFDVDIDLSAGNWYVHLWSPEKIYTAELGLRSEDGSFSLLARSNTVRTPPGWPVPPAGSPVPEPISEDEIVPEVDAASPSEPEPAATPEITPEPIPEPDVEPILAPAPELLPPAPRPKPVVSAQLQHKLAELFAIRGELPPLPELDSITEFAASWPELPELVAEFPEPPPFRLQDLEDVDLTQYTESRFTPGVSSEGGPLGD